MRKTIGKRFRWYTDERSRMKATVDKETCIGGGLCRDICPAVFITNDDAKAGVALTPVPPDTTAACREAVASCPVGAITLTAG
ncbi:MAG: ferredoxin [Chitinispirillaceae bacterium]|nr:ferredoxin [Chitinispirillaceae bacterium]